MDIQNFFELQRQLDLPIIEKHGLQGVDLFDKKKLAFKDELSELLHEWRGHKFWSTDQKPRTKGIRNCAMMEEDKVYYNPLLDEYVDGLHFALSVGLEAEWSKYIEEPNYVLKTVPDSLNEALVSVFNDLFENSLVHLSDYIRLVSDYYYLGALLGFSREEIEIAYLTKNAINHTRQVLNY